MKIRTKAAAVCAAVITLTVVGAFTQPASATWQAQNIKYLGGGGKSAPTIP